MQLSSRGAPTDEKSRLDCARERQACGRRGSSWAVVLVLGSWELTFGVKGGGNLKPCAWDGGAQISFAMIGSMPEFVQTQTRA